MKRKFMKGGEAVAEAAIRAGCRFYAGYPITPQNETPEYFARRMPDVGGVFLQGESEIASVNMVLGAAIAGAKAMTSSSSVGIALKSEGISQAANGCQPIVIANFMRGGPGGGTIQPAQNDYLQATKASGNGGFKMIVFAPCDVQEAVDLTYEAFKVAERDRHPSLVLVDGCIASMMEPVILPPMRTDEELKAELDGRRNWICHGRRTRGWNAIELDLWYGRSAMVNAEAEAKTGKPVMEHTLENANKLWAELYEQWEKNDTRVECYLTDDAEYIITGYGTGGRVCKSAVNALREEGYKVGLIRPIIISPFPVNAYKELDASKIKFVLGSEMAIPGQMFEDVQASLCDRIPSYYYGRSGGHILETEEIVEAFKSHLQ